MGSEAGGQQKRHKNHSDSLPALLTVMKPIMPIQIALIISTFPSKHQSASITITTSYRFISAFYFSFHPLFPASARHPVPLIRTSDLSQQIFQQASLISLLTWKFFPRAPSILSQLHLRGEHLDFTALPRGVKEIA